MTNKILLFLIACCFIGIILSCLATVPSFGGIAHVEIPSDEIEIEFIPTHSLYQKRCIQENTLVYCANLLSLNGQ